MNLKKIATRLLMAGLLAGLLPNILPAQQEAHYSQYMFNGLFLNPAYAGSRGQASMSAIARSQWTSFPGAPRSQAFSIHAPSADLRHGFGAVVSNDVVGPLSTTGMSIQYAYRIPVGPDQFLSLGLQGMFDYYRTDFATLNLENPTDESFAGLDVRRWLPNAGTGIYFQGLKAYAGLSMPRLIRNRLDPLRKDNGAKQSRHAFLTGGLLLDLSDAVKFRPSALLKYSGGDSPQLDLNASFLFREKLWLGASWRTEDAVVLMAEFWPVSQLRLGYAYDINTSALRTFNGGSHELMLSFDFAFKKGKVISPRYF